MKVPLPLKEELKFVSTTHGAQYVMTIGMAQMLELSADNWDYHGHVRISSTYSSTVKYERISIVHCAVAAAVGNARYGEGEGRILLDDVECGGFERSLLGCTANRIGEHNCAHFEDAGVMCPGGEDSAIVGVSYWDELVVEQLCILR